MDVNKLAAVYQRRGVLAWTSERECNAGRGGRGVRDDEIWLVSRRVLFAILS